MSVLLCLCACPDDPTAARIAEMLVQERLAACVNVLPGMRSVYRWQGRVESANEVLLIAKTTQTRAEALRERIIALHPYELAEVILVEVDGGAPAYLEWVATQTVADPGMTS